jgi:hypothetical protein
MAPSIAQDPVEHPQIQVKQAFDDKAHQGVSPSFEDLKLY